MKNILLILITVFTVQIVVAQNTTYGLKGGLNYSGFHNQGDNSDNISGEYKFGFHMGGFAKIKLTQKIFLQPELLLSLQGQDFKDNTSFESDSYGYYYTFGSRNYFDAYIIRNFSYRFYYANLPVIFKYYLNENFSFDLGSQIGYLFNARLVEEFKLKTFNQSDKIIEETSNFNAENKIDLSLNAGIGYEFNKNIGVNLRYTYGLVEVLDEKDFDNSIFSEKNSVLQLSFEFSFN